MDSLRSQLKDCWNQKDNMMKNRDSYKKEAERAHASAKRWRDLYKQCMQGPQQSTRRNTRRRRSPTRRSPTRRSPTRRSPRSYSRTRERKNKIKRGGFHLYKRLGISKYSSKQKIKKAYKKLKQKGKLTKKIKYAYKILSNHKSRKKYNKR